MLTRIVEYALRFRGIVIALACLLVGYGIFVAARAKLDVFPEFVQPQVVIQAEAPGLAPEQVEMLVTRPIESALSGVGNLEAIRSESIQGLSVVTVLFKEGTDIYLDRQLLAERLGEIAGELPAGVRSPTMSPLTSSTMDLLKFGLVSDRLSPIALRTFADWTVRPRVLSVPGVAKCSVFGGEVRQLQIRVQPDRLQAWGLALTDVLAAGRAATGVRGAGFIETAAQRVVLQAEGQALTAEALGEVVITRRLGQSIRIKDVATVTEGGAPKFGDALVMGRPGVLLTMSGQYGANTLEVTQRVEQALDELKPLFAAQGITYWPALHRPATFIENALANIRNSLLLGGALVAVVLFLFLLDLRTAFISFTAIPLSLLTAVIVLDHFGASLNTLTLGGFAVAIGVVVDDAIIDVENILRRLRENQGSAQPRSLFRVVLTASIEVRSAIVYATFIVALVFLPVLTMTGLQGRFFAPLATAFLLAILASLVVALTVTPALCHLLLARAGARAEPRYLRWLKTGHERMVRAAVTWRWPMLGGALLLVLLAAALLPFFGGEFLPSFRERHFVLQISTAPGTSLPEMLRLGARISSALLARTQYVATVEQQIGRAEQGEDTWGPHRSEFHVELKHVSGRAEAEAQDEIRALLESFPGVQSEVLTFLGDRIGETLSGETAAVVVSIFGEDLDAIDAKAQEVAAVLKNLGGEDVQVKSPPGAPQLAIRLRPDRLTQFGFRPVEVLEAVEAAYQGALVAQAYDGNRVFDVTVILDPAERRDPTRVGSLLLKNASGLQLPLHELADLYLTSGRYAILHDDARRRQTVTCNPSGRDVTSFVAAAKQAMAARVHLPSGVYLVFSGAAEAERAARQELLLHSGIGAVGILLLLALVFRSTRNVLLVLANVPFALVGGVLAVFLAGKLSASGEPALSLGSLVGFVALFGITARNSIMLISHYEHLVRHEGTTWGLDTAARGASERLVPILMTALVTALGLLPLALGSGESGRELEGPMATVILGGLVTSTLLNLLVLPVLALAYGRFGSEPIPRT